MKTAYLNNSYGFSAKMAELRAPSGYGTERDAREIQAFIFLNL
jgi:hypothetical protein